MPPAAEGARGIGQEGSASASTNGRAYGSSMSSSSQASGETQPLRCARFRARVTEALCRLIREGGEPAVLRSDLSPEFVSKAPLRWAVANRLETALIDPGKPWQNGTNESFNGKFRDECLAMEWFRTRNEAKVVIEAWRRHYNEVRPHSSLGQQTPAAFSKSCGIAAESEASFQ